MNRRPHPWVLAVLVALALWAAIDFFSNRHFLSLLPPGFAAEKIAYAETNSWGFGPGGNETGVIIFEIPSHIANADPGALAPQLNWEATPLQGHREWFEGEGTLHSSRMGGPMLYNYLNRYGFSIHIAPEIMNEVDMAVGEPGNWYAYTRGGIIIFTPSSNRLAFVFSG